MDSLSEAVANGNLDTLLALLKSGRSPNGGNHSTSGNGQNEKTPLMLAVENNHIECARVLIKHGANLDSVYLKQVSDNSEY